MTQVAAKGHQSRNILFSVACKIAPNLKTSWVSVERISLYPAHYEKGRTKQASLLDNGHNARSNLMTLHSQHLLQRMFGNTWVFFETTLGIRQPGLAKRNVDPQTVALLDQ